MKVVILNGPMGVGKTTVGMYLAESHPGTAFIDGDWCMDLHPFVGNRETKAMALDNILHMIGNYRECSHCRMIVLVWLMDDAWVREKLVKGIGSMGLEIREVTLVCREEELVSRWKQDDKCPWRTDHWLQVSLKSLPGFWTMKNTLDTTGLTVRQIVETIMQ